MVALGVTVLAHAQNLADPVPLKTIEGVVKRNGNPMESRKPPSPASVEVAALRGMVPTCPATPMLIGVMSRASTNTYFVPSGIVSVLEPELRVSTVPITLDIYNFASQQDWRDPNSRQRHGAGYEIHHNPDDR